MGRDGDVAPFLVFRLASGRPVLPAVPDTQDHHSIRAQQVGDDVPGAGHELARSRDTSRSAPRREVLQAAYRRQKVVHLSEGCAWIALMQEFERRAQVGLCWAGDEDLQEVGLPAM